MESVNKLSVNAAPQSALAAGAAVPAFVAAIFTSAFLLFAIQPLFTKMALPLLGGSPNVWNTAMVFFQATLLLGYIYAHFLSVKFSLRHQALIHASVLIVGLLFLPLAIPEGWRPPSQGAQSFWLIGLMAVAIGAPFFALSANAPLLQRWFSHTAHRTADDPYYLYAASNVGSIISLLAYPIVFEPLFGLKTQSWLWTIGYIGLIGAIAAAAFVALNWRRFESENAAPAGVDEATSVVAVKDRVWWVALAIVPSGLMLSVTTHLTTNVAPSPFLWVAPLTLYLLSFVIVFSAAGEKVRTSVRSLTPLLLLFGAVAGPILFRDGLLASAIHLVIFFVVAIACHGELAARRPSASRLTEFYLWMSFGGVLGGIFTALAAPMIFPGIWEYPILISAAAFLSADALLRAKADVPPLDRKLLAAVALVSAIGFTLPMFGEDIAAKAVVFVFLLSAICVLAGIAYRKRRSPAIFTASIAGVLLIAPAAQEMMYGSLGKRVAQERSFFGVSTVHTADLEDIGPTNILVHGNTIHNMQVRTAQDETTPIAYFSTMGPYGQMLEGMRRDRENMSVAVVGLGAGALACHVKDGEAWTFFEIDPTVVKIAQNEKQFSFLSKCAPDAPIKMGDGRISLTKEKQTGAPLYDVIVIDAFSSDSIPAHLITREALALYRDRLKSGGLVFFHTSNKFLDVSSVASRIAKDAELDWRAIRYKAPEDHRLAGLITDVQAVIVGDPDVIARVTEGKPDWKREEPHPLVNTWTDDYSNVLATLIAFKSRKSEDAD